jgi:hypothetical protein
LRVEALIGEPLGVIPATNLTVPGSPKFA